MQTQIVMVLFAPYANVAQSVEQLIRNNILNHFTLLAKCIII